MKKLLNISLILIFLSAFLSCQDSSTGSDDELDEASSQKQFIWNAMNYWYFWQADVPELADDHAFFDDEQDFHDYLMSYSTPEALFYDGLVYEYEEIDRFSFFISDYEEFNQAQQGNVNSFGFEFGLVRECETCVNIFGYVQYIIPNSPAEESDLERGDIFTSVNGSRLTANNYQTVLAGDTYELSLAQIDENETITETGETITLHRASVQENPIYISKVINTGPAKVGYLMYNAFQTNSHENLNNAFGDFISEGIDELVLDLRYNGGGAVITSAILASMISGLGGSSDFARYTFNSKRSNQNVTLEFQDQVTLLDENRNPVSQISMNKLSIDQVYILTGFGTASASEAVINGLKPFMDIILIGRQTVGKDEGSYTLYDTPNPPYTDRSAANPDHKIAIQPIVLKIVNTNGETYPAGFMPDFAVNEIGFLGNLPPLGDTTDPLLAKALEEISGAPVAKLQAAEPYLEASMFKDSRDLRKFGKEMYILPDQIKD